MAYGKSLILFRQVYQQHTSIDVCIAELRRRGFTQMDTVRALMECKGIAVVKADEMVATSLTWS